MLNLVETCISTLLCKADLTLNDLYDTTCMIQLVWLCKMENLYKNLIYTYLYDITFSVSSTLYEGNRPITFHVLQCWIILKKNIVQLIELNSGDLFFISFLREVKKIREVIWGERTEETKARKEGNFELLHVEYKQ